MTYADVDRVARLVPTMPAWFGVMTIDKALQEGAGAREAYERPDDREAYRHGARSSRGWPATPARTPPASSSRRSRWRTSCRCSGRPPATRDALPTTQYAMNDVAELGLLKMDFLGLTNLTILGLAVEVIETSRGVDVDLAKLPDGDAKTYEMLSAGDTFGVFQLESGGMRRAVQELRPNSVKDLAALVALYRPGPMQHIADLHPRQARPGGDRLPARGPGGTPGRDVRGHRLPGPGAAHRPEVRRLHAGPGGHHAQGDGQEDQGDDVRRRSSGSWRAPPPRATAASRRSRYTI